MPERRAFYTGMLSVSHELVLFFCRDASWPHCRLLMVKAHGHDMSAHLRRPEPRGGGGGSRPVLLPTRSESAAVPPPPLFFVNFCRDRFCLQVEVCMLMEREARACPQRANYSP